MRLGSLAKNEDEEIWYFIFAQSIFALSLSLSLSLLYTHTPTHPHTHTTLSASLQLTPIHMEIQRENTFSYSLFRTRFYSLPLSLSLSFIANVRGYLKWSFNGQKTLLLFSWDTLSLLEDRTKVNFICLHFQVYIIIQTRWYFWNLLKINNVFKSI